MKVSMKKKILITGSNGMLGKDVANLFLKNSNYEVFGINRKIDDKLDENHSFICDLNEFEKLEKILEKINPDIIIHTAANISLDDCEKNYENARRINVQSTEMLAKFSNGKRKLIYISTDSVFDGTKLLYNENDKPLPLNKYAVSKLGGEEVIINNSSNYTIVRTNIYGFNNPLKTSLVEWALGELKSGKVIYGFNDVIFNPLYTGQLAEIISELIIKDFIGILHVGCKNGISKLDFLKKLALQFRYDLDLIKERSVEEVNFSIKRPKNTVLDTSKFKKMFNYELFIENGIEKLFEDYKNKFYGG